MGDADDEQVELAWCRIRELLDLDDGLERARAAAHEVVRDRPRTPDAWLLLAAVHVDDPDEVRHAVDRAIELAPDDPDVLLRAGGLLADVALHKEAAELVPRVRDLVDDQHPDALALRAALLQLMGRLQHHRGDVAHAEVALRKAVEFAPREARHVVALASFYLDEARPAAARAVIGAAPDDVRADSRLAAVRSRLGDIASQYGAPGTNTTADDVTWLGRRS